MQWRRRWQLQQWWGWWRWRRWWRWRQWQWRRWQELRRLWRYFARRLIGNRKSVCPTNFGDRSHKCNKSQMQSRRILGIQAKIWPPKLTMHIWHIRLTQDFIKNPPKFATRQKTWQKTINFETWLLLNTKQPIKVDLVAHIDSIKGRLKDGLDSFRVCYS